MNLSKETDYKKQSEVYWNNEWAKSEGSITNEELDILTNPEKTLETVKLFQQNQVDLDLHRRGTDLFNKEMLKVRSLKKRNIINTLLLGVTSFSTLIFIFSNYTLNKDLDKVTASLKKSDNANQELTNTNNDLEKISKELLGEKQNLERKINELEAKKFPSKVAQPQDTSILTKRFEDFDKAELQAFIKELFRANKRDFDRYTLSNYSNGFTYGNIVVDENMRAINTTIDSIDGIYSNLRGSGMAVNFREY